MLNLLYIEWTFCICVIGFCSEWWNIVLTFNFSFLWGSFRDGRIFYFTIFLYFVNCVEICSTTCKDVTCIFCKVEKIRIFLSLSNFCKDDWWIVESTINIFEIIPNRCFVVYFLLFTKISNVGNIFNSHQQVFQNY